MITFGLRFRYSYIEMADDMTVSEENYNMLGQCVNAIKESNSAEMNRILSGEK